MTVRDVAPSPAIVLAVSTEPLLVHVSAQDVFGGFLSAAELVDVGLEMCFVDGAGAPAFDEKWYPLEIENRQVGGVYAPAYLIVGPGVLSGTGPSLDANTYSRWVRTVPVPHVVRRLSALIIEGPNP